MGMFLRSTFNLLLKENFACRNENYVRGKKVYSSVPIPRYLFTIQEQFLLHNELHKLMKTNLLLILIRVCI